MGNWRAVKIGDSWGIDKHDGKPFVVGLSEEQAAAIVAAHDDAIAESDESWSYAVVEAGETSD